VQFRAVESTRTRMEVIVSVLISVARTRLVETENPSACATVNCKLCKSVIGCIKREIVTEVPINPITRTRAVIFVTLTPYK
jgi:hypothetical protein